MSEAWPFDVFDIDRHTVVTLRNGSKVVAAGSFEVSAWLEGHGVNPDHVYRFRALRLFGRVFGFLAYRYATPRRPSRVSRGSAARAVPKLVLL